MKARILHGDCIGHMKALADDGERFDGCLCDPPYHLTSIVKRFGKAGSAAAQQGTDGAFSRASRGFMGKVWDGGDIAFQPDTWRLLFDILKPGAYVVAFSSSRTFGRMSVAIEDAGFITHPMVCWMFACLDDETEALTRSGWKPHTALSEADEVAQWDHETGEISWVHPEKVHRYHYAGPMVRLVNRHTDQMLTPNHRVFARVRRHSRNPAPTNFEAIEASLLRRHWQISLPVAGILKGGNGPDPDFAYLVGWWLTDAWRHGDGKAVMFSQCKPETLAKLRAALAPHEPSEYVKAGKKVTHQDEHTFYVTGPLASRLISEHGERKLTWEMLSWGEEARRALFRGLMDGDGSMRPTQYAHTFWSKVADRRAVFAALAATLGHRILEDAEKGCVHVNGSTVTTELQIKHRVADERYDGTVWCVTVPTGAFMVRRHGKVFITGNSGFPKAHRLDLPDTDHLRYGAQALKPALEPIYVGQKPMEGTGTENWLAHGVGALNIDAGRIPTSESLGGGDVSSGTKAKVEGWDRPWMHDDVAKAAHAVRVGEGVARAEALGRWPANLVHDGSAAVLEAFEQFGVRASGDDCVRRQEGYWGAGDSRHGGLGKAGDVQTTYGDQGSAARFFFSAKAGPDDHFGSSHPTIKPVSLIKWLADLHLPQGARLIDPFAGTAPVVFARPDLDMTLIEREDEYVADIKRRIAHVEGGGMLRSQEIALRKGGQAEPPPADGLFGWTGAGDAA